MNQPTVSRRIEKGTEGPREHLNKAGFIISAGVLATLLADNAACAAPASVVAAAAKAALARGFLVHQVTGSQAVPEGEMLERDSESPATPHLDRS